MSASPFASNDERTAKRISDALGAATELRAQKNYAGHRLSPWLGHLMVSRQETARQLLTPGEVMQLPPDEEIVMVSGHPPIRAKKIRFYADANFKGRALPARSCPAMAMPISRRLGSTTGRSRQRQAQLHRPVQASAQLDEDEGGLRRQPELDMTVPQAAPVEEEPSRDVGSLLDDDDDGDVEVERMRAGRVARQQGAQRLARNAALDPDDGIAL